jgi:chromosome segregation ATPase
VAEPSSENKGSVFHGIFSKVTDIFTEEVPGSESSNVSTVQPTATATAPATTTVADKTAAPVRIQSDDIDDEAYKAICRSIRKKGPEYEKFFGMVNSLSEEIRDEAALFRSSVKALKAQGPFDSNKVVQAIENQIGALPEEKRKFDSYAADKEKEIIAQETEIESKKQKLEELKRQIEEMETDIESRESNATRVRQSIEQTRTRFEATLAKVEADLTADKQKVLNYLIK